MHPLDSRAANPATELILRAQYDLANNPQVKQDVALRYDCRTEGVLEFEWLGKLWNLPAPTLHEAINRRAEARTELFRIFWKRATNTGPWYFDKYESTVGPLLPQVHWLKSSPDNYRRLRAGVNVEFRFNDRGYQVGDTLVLQEWEPARGEQYTTPSYGGSNYVHNMRQPYYPARFTNRERQGKVVAVLSQAELLRTGAHGGLQPGWVALAVELE